MQCTEYSKIWLNLTFAALSLTFIRGHKVFPVFMADRVIYQVTLWSRSTFQNLESTMWLAKLGKGMLFLVEQAFVRRDVTQAPLKTPADVGGYMQCKFQKIINSLCKSPTAVASQGKVKNFAHPTWWCWLTVNMCCFKVDLKILRRIEGNHTHWTDKSLVKSKYSHTTSHHLILPRSVSHYIGVRRISILRSILVNKGSLKYAIFCIIHFGLKYIQS